MGESRTPLWGRAAIVALVIAAALVTTLLLRRPIAFIDLGVYAWAAQEAFQPTQLYESAQPGTGLRFTYPPFAAASFWLLETLGLLGRAPFTMLSIACLLRSCWLLAGHRGAMLGGWSRGWVAVALAAATVLVEPGGATLMLGQVSFILLWLVVEGMLGPLRSRPVGGMGVGIATAIKLTPGIYLAQLALARRWRHAAVALGTLAVTVAAGWVLLPAESAAFWRGTGVDADRVGAIEYITNQSINGVLWRILGPGGSTAAWLVLGVAVLVCCLALARRYDVAGERASAVGLAGLAAVLVSPVSWTHHWVVVLPLVVGVLASGRRAVPVAALTLGTCMLLGSRVFLQVPQQDGREFRHTPFELVLSSSYVLGGLALLAAAWLARPRRP